MMRGTIAVAAALVVSGVSAQNRSVPNALDQTYLTWTAAQAVSIGESAYKRGRAGGLFDGRVLKTERAYNYKLAATLFTPEVIRASARLHQLSSRLSVEQTRALVAEAESVDGTVVMIEVDPREGSGVIPLDWEAFLQPRGNTAAAVHGVNTPELRNAKALAGVLRRNYDYDRFWMVFPKGVQSAYLQGDVKSIELIVRIHDKEGRVEWPSSFLKDEALHRAR